MRIFGSAIDIALRGTDCDGGDGHAFDENEGIAFHDHAVGVGAAVAFVRVAADVFLIRCSAQHRLPLDTGGKTSAAASPQSRVGDFGDDLFRRQAQGTLQSAIAAVRDVIRQRQRIHDAAAGEGQALLLLEIGNVFSGPEMQRVGVAL